ncbi:MAG: hypothetical protein ACLFWF_08770 [Alphaproteobacteria bacterium]
MSGQGHIGRSLTGALALARFDRRGLEYFDFSYDGFWRSFNAIPAALPLIAIWTFVTVQQAAQSAEPAGGETAQMLLPQNVPAFIVVQVLSFAAAWLFFPVAMIWVARLLRMGDRYVPLIVANNWGGLAATYAIFTPLLLYAVALSNLLSAELFVTFEFMILLFVLAYRWFVIHAAARVPAVTAGGLLLFDLFGAMMVLMLFSQLYFLFDPGTPVSPGNT